MFGIGFQDAMQLKIVFAVQGMFLLDVFSNGAENDGR
jgi:hypothetical protein